jgi:hypothetical protein
MGDLDGLVPSIDKLGPHPRDGLKDKLLVLVGHEIDPGEKTDISDAYPMGKIMNKLHWDSNTTEGLLMTPGGEDIADRLLAEPDRPDFWKDILNLCTQLAEPNENGVCPIWRGDLQDRMVHLRGALKDDKVADVWKRLMIFKDDTGQHQPVKRTDGGEDGGGPAKRQRVGGGGGGSGAIALIGCAVLLSFILYRS